MLEVSRGELPREYNSWEEVNHKIPVEWRDGKAGEVQILFDTPDTMPDAPNSGSNRKNGIAGLGNQAISVSSIPEESLLRTPAAIEGGGGANSASMKKAKGRMVMLRDQMADLAAENGLKVSDAINQGFTDYSLEEDSNSVIELFIDGEVSLLPTPVVNDMGANKSVEAWDEWTEKTKAKHNNGNGHGASLSIELLRLLPTPTTIDAKSVDVANQMETRNSPGLHAITGLLGMPIETWETTGQTELLPTPNTMDSLPARTPEQLEEAKKRTPAGYSNLRETVVNDLFPTPTTMDTKASNNAETAQKFIDEGRQTCLTYEVTLLPTPLVDDSKNTGHNTNRIPTLASVTYQTEKSNSWGKFAPAIERWEKVLGRQAPAPTKADGKDGAHRLSSLFTEWLMGLPEGWVTGAGLKRNEELKACGNGVVPQQAALALRVILAELDEIKENN
jgi:hypothetical protein